MPRIGGRGLGGVPWRSANSIVKQIIPFFVVVALLTGCSPAAELARVTSPDGKACIIVATKEKHGMALPGPEPPKTLGKWARFSLEVRGKKVHDTGDQDVGVYQSLPFALDVAWAPDSAHAAYRLLTTLYIVGRDGAVHQADITCTDSLISSFKWLSNEELMVVVKEIDEPLNMFGYPQHYHGYLAKAKSIKILRVGVNGRVSERFTHPVNEPTFMFHSIGFQNQEISASSERVAFSDGAAVCVYDDAAGKVVAKASITGPVEGTWWETDDKVIVGIGLLSSSDRSFASVDVADSKVQDITSTVLPLWDGQWASADWFRAAKAE